MGTPLDHSQNKSFFFFFYINSSDKKIRGIDI